MKRKINIKAFTLLESLITLMLISIIIALSFALINLIGKQLTVFEKENVEILEYNLFNSAIINDINNSNDFDYSDSILQLYFYDNTSLEYEIKTKVIIRRQELKQDTFRIITAGYIFKKGLDKTALKDYLEIKLRLLKDTITTNYYLDRSHAKQINKQLFNED